MEIKENIQWLCKFLNLNGFTSLKSETFRQAKFNKNEAIYPLWKLLYEFVAWLQEKQVKSCGELENDKIIVLKEKIQLLGYHSSFFLKLEYDSKLCSCELLLTLGWLISKYRLLDMLVASCIRSSLINCEDVSCIEKREDKKPHDFPQSVSEYINQIIWSLNYLKFSLNSLSTVQHMKIKYLHEIHQKTEGKSLIPDSIHLSMLHSTIINSNDLEKKYVEQLEKETKIFKAYICWKKGEEVFWKWMESVIELQYKENTIFKDIEKETVEKDYLLNKMSNQTILPSVDFKNYSRIYNIPFYEPRLIFRTQKSYKDTKTMKEMNEELKNVKLQLMKEIDSKHNKYQVIFEKLSKKIHGIIYIPS